MGEYAPHVQQAVNELDNALRLENAEAEKAARKRLDAAGVDSEQAVSDLRSHAASQRRTAMQAEVGDRARTTTPQGRTTKAQATTTEKKS